MINPRLVRSQYLGGMIWGISFALHEHAVIDKRSGRPMNANLAEYHIPVNADVPSVEAIIVEERDDHVNPLGIKGVGEIGITGTVGAIANAIWHATEPGCVRFLLHSTSYCEAYRYGKKARPSFLKKEAKKLLLNWLRPFHRGSA